MDVPPPDGSWPDRLVADLKVRATYASLLAHVAVFLLMAMLASASRPAPRSPIQIALTSTEASDIIPVEIHVGATPAPPPQDTPVTPGSLDPAVTVVAMSPTSVSPAAEIAPPVVEPSDRLAMMMPISSMIETLAAPRNPPAADDRQPDSAQPSHPGNTPSQNAFAGRRGDGRSKRVAQRGGSAASEAAVERGLEWLARHQAVDGSWRFDLSACGCDSACSHPGTVTSTTAATGIALLPFLGAGHTHTDGMYRETVNRGLYYLMSRMRPSPRGGDLSEGTMYGQGVATLALAEAFGMSGDTMLAAYVRDAVRFIETSQDMHGGGWRYLPGQAGDTTVTAWQIAALKSAALAGEAVPSPTIDAACRFLDRVQVRQGEGYGYLAPQDRACTSAVGLVCRIYTAWPDVGTLDRGLTRLARPGPSPEAVYQNFYLAQALLLREHPAWPRWNARNRDQLVARQERLGHESGSWTFIDADTAPGGRLGHTALAILTLEVYYRLLPIYGERVTETGW
jgi:hypothetical protein